MDDMKPEDVKPVKIALVGVNYSGGYRYIHNANGDEIQNVIPAHEVGAIIKAAISAGYLQGLHDAKEGPNDSAKEYHAWLERADELEGME